eukprot:1816552-Karenia_brevis.AAC.1
MQQYVDTAILPTNNAVAALTSEIKQQKLVTDLHTKRFERLEKMLELESTTVPMRSNTSQYDRQIDEKI